MQIFVNGREAFIKAGSTFEYVSENRLFTGADSYTLSIVFPLRGCIDNIAIFGHIYRVDANPQDFQFQCEIRDMNIIRHGLLTVTQFNESEVTGQFLEGRSENNFRTDFSKIYVNELDLGSPKSVIPSQVRPLYAMQGTYDTDAVALPWVNEASGNIQNKVGYNADIDREDDRWEWSPLITRLSFMPYLGYIIDRICSAVGYTWNYSQWKSRKDLRNLLVCNALPGPWYMPGYAHALPHWTVEEWFQKLELFLGAQIDIDHKEKTVTFTFNDMLLSEMPEIYIATVVDQHSSEVDAEDPDCNYINAAGLKYAEGGHMMDKFYSCDWFIRDNKDSALEYATTGLVFNAARPFMKTAEGNRRGTNMGKLFHAQDSDTYYVIRSLWKTHRKGTSNPKIYDYTRCLQAVNSFGKRYVDGIETDDDKSTEIDFVPVCVAETDEANGFCMFLSFSGMDVDESELTDEDDTDSILYQPTGAATIMAGQKESSEYYSKVYIAWWDGILRETPQLPYPHIENMWISKDLTDYKKLDFSLRLNGEGSLHNYGSVIDVRRKVTFSFLADTIPEVKSVFNIQGKRYICEKITATFSENGMSRLLKGVFWPIKE